MGRWLSGTFIYGHCGPLSKDDFTAETQRSRRGCAEKAKWVLMKHEWIDITQPIRHGMAVWPGDPETVVVPLAAMERGDANNTSSISMCLHAGTHIDAPRHYVAAGAPVDAMPVDALCGPARVIEIHAPRAITAEELRPQYLQDGERVLFKTRNSGRTEAGFYENYVALALHAAEYLVKRRVRAAGIDALSIGPMGEEGDAVHRILLGAGIWVIEGLDLGRVPAGEYELVCLPLKVEGADGAPARAMLRAIG